MQSSKKIMSILMSVIMLMTTFTVVPFEASAATKLSTPKVKVSVSGNSLTVNYDKVKGASECIIEYTTNYSFKKSTKKVVLN